MQKGVVSIVKHNVECNIDLEYTLLVASNAHISTILSHPLWKNVNEWKNYVPAVPVIMTFKVLKYFSNGKINFFLFACLEKNFFFRNLDPHNSRPFSPEKCWFLACICLIWKLIEYANDHSPDASIIPTF